MHLKTWVFALTCLVSNLAGATTPADFSSRVPLQVSGKGTWYRLQLPVEVLLAARYGDLRDLRIFNAEGEALPYSLSESAANQHSVRTQVQAKFFPLYGPAGDPSTESVKVQRSSTGTILEITPETKTQGQPILRGWLLENGSADLPLERLELDWQAAEGFQRLRIEASDDLENWHSLGDGQLARLDFNGQHIERNDIKLPGQSARYLRLWWQSPEQAAQLKAASLSGSRSSSGPVPMLWSAPIPTQANAEGQFVWTLPLALPVEQVRIPLEANSLAPVQLSGRRDAKVQWYSLAQGVLYRLGSGQDETRQETLELDGSPVSQLRLQVDARGSGLGKQTASLSLGMRAREVVFLARGSEPFQLAVGNPAAINASLPLSVLVPDSALLPNLDSAVLKGSLQGLPAQAPVESATRDSQWKRYGLWGVLLLGVVLLGLMSLSLLRSNRAKD